MAPLPPNSTARFRIFYTGIGVQHSVEIRSGASPSAVGTIVDDLLTAIDGALQALVIDEVQFAANGSDVFNAVTTGIEGNPYGTGGGITSQAANYYNFIGRSSGGRRVRLALFGANSQAGDYRFVAGENSALDAARAVLVAAAGDILAIDGLTPTWKTYINAGVNAHWQRALRP